jgi:hypothetical protein
LEIDQLSFGKERGAATEFRPYDSTRVAHLSLSEIGNGLFALRQSLP